MRTIELGEIVLSTAGRDQSRKFIVTGIIDDKYVYISDGELRKISNPKKKKTKHLKKLGIIAEEIRSKLQSGKTVMDSDIRKFLKALDY